MDEYDRKLKELEEHIRRSHDLEVKVSADDGSLTELLDKYDQRNAVSRWITRTVRDTDFDDSFIIKSWLGTSLLLLIGLMSGFIRTNLGMFGQFVCLALFGCVGIPAAGIILMVSYWIIILLSFPWNALCDLLHLPEARLEL